MNDGDILVVGEYAKSALRCKPSAVIALVLVSCRGFEDRWSDYLARPPCLLHSCWPDFHQHFRCRLDCCMRIDVLEKAYWYLLRRNFATRGGGHKSYHEVVDRVNIIAQGQTSLGTLS